MMSVVAIMKLRASTRLKGPEEAEATQDTSLPSTCGKDRFTATHSQRRGCMGEPTAHTRFMRSQANVMKEPGDVWSAPKPPAVLGVAPFPLLTAPNLV